jgi:hypothetical protein
MTEWTRYAPKGEMPFWGREPDTHDTLDGWDPLSGLIIAHTDEDRERLSRKDDMPNANCADCGDPFRSVVNSGDKGRCGPCRSQH